MRTAGQSQSTRKKTTIKYSCEYLKGERMKFKHTPKRRARAQTALSTARSLKQWSGTGSRKRIDNAGKRRIMGT
nr:MAG TPA: hypothetical protein [Caudoviricetes sp.]